VGKKGTGTYYKRSNEEPVAHEPDESGKIVRYTGPVRRRPGPSCCRPRRCRHRSFPSKPDRRLLVHLQIAGVAQFCGAGLSRTDKLEHLGESVGDSGQQRRHDAEREDGAGGIVHVEVAADA
jgi:hypothetical protein